MRELRKHEVYAGVWREGGREEGRKEGVGSFGSRSVRRRKEEEGGKGGIESRVSIESGE
jgi:hypothetical protein